MALPAALELERSNVVCRGEVNFNTSTVTAANAYSSLGYDNSWSEEEWKRNFQVVVNRIEGHDMEFDLVNLDPAVANALRRILIADVPTMAIEHVFFVNNTSIIADEVLAHRIGLIPLNIDPDKFEAKKREEEANEKNTVVFKLNVRCKRGKGGVMEGSKVLASQFEWLPNGSEMPDETNCRFAAGQSGMLDKPAGPVVEDILVAKLRPGQAIDLEAHATRGTGGEHAKWSPVATAWYRLLPEVVLTQRVAGKDAEQLAATCPGLFTLQEGDGGEKTAVAAPAREHENQLEKLRHLSAEPGWRERLRLQKRKEHFIFTIESVGAIPPPDLFHKALDLLEAKCDRLLARL